MHHAPLAFIILAAAGLAAAPSARAQTFDTSPTTRGLILSGHVSWSAVTLGRDAADAGPGVGALVGFGFTDRVALWGMWDFTDVPRDEGDFPSGYQVTHLGAGVRLHFPRQRRAWLPYADLGLGVRSFEGSLVASDTGRLTARSAVAIAGGGVQYYFTPSIAFDAAARLAYGTFSEHDLDGNDFPERGRTTALTTRANFGLAWYANIGRRLLGKRGVR